MAVTVQEEQNAFEQQLPELLAEHQGQFVLFKEGRPVEFFADHRTAYEAGLNRFGLDEIFLVAPVEPLRRQPISLSLQAGVLFG